jgi:hypothetical protein
LHLRTRGGLPVDWTPTEGYRNLGNEKPIVSQKTQTLAILVAVSGLTGAHVLVAHGTHGRYEIRIILGGIYLIPIIATVVWLGLRGGLATTAVISLAYYAHLRSWPNQPMENTNQVGMILVYWIVGPSPEF